MEQEYMLDINQLSKQQQMIEGQKLMNSIQNGFGLMRENQARMERFKRDHMEGVRHRQTLQIQTMIGLNLFNAICADTPFGSDPGEAEWAIDGNGG